MRSIRPPTNLLPPPPDFGIDISDIGSHHSLPDMIHRFPTAAEYEKLNRKREKRKRQIMLAAGAVFVIIFFSILLPGGDKEHNAKASVIDHSGYNMISATYLPEIQADLVVYYHKKTLTEVMTLVPDDTSQDAVFGVSFRTLPEADNGAAHVLMHSVLHGSRQFPLKDPFEELRRGSLQTYLKQLVLADRTVYACASRNLQDFKNLIYVYIDAVFDPNFLQPGYEWIFRQEGWRIEKDAADDASGNPTHHFNGAVLEMQKGAYSDPDVSIHKYAHRALFPDTQYQFDNEGFPGGVLSTTQSSISDYHHKYYHPTNAQVFLYGPLEAVTEGLDQIDNYVGKYDLKQDIRDASAPKWQDKIFPGAGPREIHEYPSTFEDGDYRVLMSWLINDHQLDAKTEIAWRMINYILMDSPTAILRERLEDSGEGREVIGGGLKTDLMQWTFSVGMKGVNRAEVATVEDIILSTLQDIQQMASFPADVLQAAFNTVEFRLTDHATGKLPRGVSLLFMALEKWNYDGMGPADAFDFQDGISDLIDEVKLNGEKFFMDLIKNNLIDNHHKVVVQLFPSTTYVADQVKAESDRMALLKQKLADADFYKLLDETGQLLLKQKTDDPQALLDTIPHVSIKDIEKNTRPNTIKLRIEANLLVAETKVESSFGILYTDFGLDLGNVDYDNVPFLPLISRLFLELGTKLWTQDQLDIAIGKDSGGIRTEIMVEGVRPKGSDWTSFVVTDESHFATKLFFRGKCLAEKMPQYFELLGQIIWFGAHFNQAKVIEVLEDMVEEVTNKIGVTGDTTVDRRIEARYSKYGLIWERLEGVTCLQRLTQGLDDAKNDWDNFNRKLDQMRAAIVEGHRNGMVLSVTGEPDLLTAAQSAIMVFIKDTIPDNDHAIPFTHPSTDNHPWVAQIREEQLVAAPIADEGIVYPETVNFVGKGGKLFEVWEPIDGAASVVAKFLEDSYLHDMITIQNGAADVHCRVDYRSGTLKFISYRDPFIAKTLDVFDQASVVLGQKILTTETLPDEAIRAIVGTIAELDGSAPQPDQIGWDFLTEYIREDTSDFRQLWRDQILNASRIDFVEFIAHMADWGSPTIAVLGSKEAMQAADKTRGIKLQTVDIVVD